MPKSCCSPSTFSTLEWCTRVCWLLWQTIQWERPHKLWPLTAEFKVNLLRGAKGEKLVCEAWVLKLGKQIMFTEAEVYAVSGNERQLVMKASGTMALTKT